MGKLGDNVGIVTDYSSRIPKTAFNKPRKNRGDLTVTIFII